MKLFAMLMEDGTMVSEVVRLENDRGQSKMTHGQYPAGGSATEAIGIFRVVECCKTIERQWIRRAVGDRRGGGSL
jgi:hypothetical protein